MSAPEDPSPAELTDSMIGAVLGARPEPETNGAGRWQPPSVVELQRRFSQYEIVAILGQGGMGVVYKGWQKALDRFVAIKILPPEVEQKDAEFARRFEREGKAMARLNHPHIVGVHDFGRTADGLLYFVMEFVEGTNLQQLIRDPGYTPAQALDIAGQLCEALSYAHGEGVVHRDIKPANVLIDKRGQVKVADFGLARLADSVAPEITGLTKEGAIMGTAEYMAPEQISGMNVDHRADIYALGVMLYEMLCRDLPRGVFDPPSSRSGCDARVDRIVHTAMQRTPERRYQSTREMKSDVDAARLPALTRSPSNRWGRRVALVLVLLALATGVLLLLRTRSWQDHPAMKQSAKKAPAAAPLPSSLSTPKGSVASAAKEASFVNSLGMKFVPVPIIGGPTNGQHVLFSIWETRVQDYGVFLAATHWPWLRPGFSQAPTHPAVNVSWDDAQAFCAWLTQQERELGTIGADRRYRLPSDYEWSCAAGIGDRENPEASPAARDRNLKDEFPWGSVWPPPNGAGNFADATLQSVLSKGAHPELKSVIPGYEDGFAETAPVASFSPNSFGLYDLSGNAWEWCEDLIDPQAQEANIGARVLRGGSWTTPDRNGLRCSIRAYTLPNATRQFNGFRCVLESIPRTAPATTTREIPFVNSLGMKFVPVTIKGGPTDGQRLLCSVWLTRVQDYETFIGKMGRNWLRPPFPQGPTHPAVNMSWEDAQAFCRWLTESERRAGRIGTDLEYRLPSDHEWSVAIGIGERENASELPGEKDKKLGSNDYSWGDAWPPPPGAGNFGGEELQPAIDAEIYNLKKRFNFVLEGYRDGFVATSPVGSFPATELGLYDVTGNAWQWMEDWYDASRTKRVVRGGSWYNGDPNSMRLSNRYELPPTSFGKIYGFRVVLAAAGRKD